MSRNVLVVNFQGIRAGWEQWIMLRSDAHHDNKWCNRDLEHQHLQLALDKGALIVDVGDLFCAMQGKYDPRSSMDDIRQEDVGADYLDRIVLHASEDYEPYAKNFLLIGSGNHETNILNRHGTNLTSNLCHALNRMGGQIHMGYYGGYVIFQFEMSETARQTKRIKYHHGKGKGGSAPVTRGVIDTNRQAVYLPDADVIVNGHNHNMYYVPIKRERVTNNFRVAFDLAHFVRTPGYKDDYGDGADGFAVESNGGPKPQGCIWVRFSPGSIHNKTMDLKIIADVA